MPGNRETCSTCEFVSLNLKDRVPRALPVGECEGGDMDILWARRPEYPAMEVIERSTGRGYPHDLVSSLASLSVFLTLGYPGIFTQGGLGVRKAIMFLMLKQSSNGQITLILPNVSRPFHIMVEALFEIIGLLTGAKPGIFSLAAFKE